VPVDYVKWHTADPDTDLGVSPSANKSKGNNSLLSRKEINTIK